MIIGPKTRFRAIEEHDLPLLAKWLNDPSIAALVVGWTFPVSETQQREWFARSSSDSRNKRWMVETAEGQTIGLTGLWDIDWQNRHALTALKIGETAQHGKGYGSDAIMLVMAYAFQQVGLERLWSEILAYNVPSYRAYVERCGWKVEGVLRKHVYRHGEFHDALRVGILKDEFLALPRVGEYLRRMESRISVAPEHIAIPLPFAP